MVEGAHFLSTGSVGKPKDGHWRAGYVLLSIGEGEPKPGFVRVDYDIERTMAAIRSSELPDEFAEQLRNGVVASWPGIPPCASNVSTTLNSQSLSPLASARTRW